MFNTSQNAMHAYASVALETGVQSANPHKLVLMLYEGALLAVSQANTHMEKGRIAAKGECISKAISIIASGLRASLDISVGGELGERLAALYEYMCQRLVLANARNSADMLIEVRALLAELHGAWAQIEPSSTATSATPTWQE